MAIAINTTYMHFKLVGKVSDTADNNYIRTPKGCELRKNFLKPNNLILQWNMKSNMNNHSSEEASSLHKNGRSCIHWRLLNIWA